MAVVVKNPHASAEDKGDVGLILGLGISLGEGDGDPLQYSCLEISMDRGAWRITVHRVSKSRTWPKWLSRQQTIKMNHFFYYSRLAGVILQTCFYPFCTVSKIFSFFLPSVFRRKFLATCDCLYFFQQIFITY